MDGFFSESLSKAVRVNKFALLPLCGLPLLGLFFVNTAIPETDGFVDDIAESAVGLSVAGALFLGAVLYLAAQKRKLQQSLF